MPGPMIDGSITPQKQKKPPYVPPKPPPPPPPPPPIPTYEFPGGAPKPQTGAAKQTLQYQQRLAELRRRAAAAAAEAARRARLAELEKRRREQLRIFALNAEARKRAVALEIKRRREFDLAEQRRKAFAEVRARQRTLMQQQAAVKVNGGNRLLPEDQVRVGNQRGGPTRTGARPDLKRASQFMPNAAELRKRRADVVFQQAEESGNMNVVLRHLLEQQTNSGGRYFDEELYQRAYDTITERAENADEFLPMYEQIQGMLDRGDVVSAQNLYNSAGYQAAMKEYLTVYGDGREKGLYQRFADLSNQIASNRDRYWERVVIGQHFGSDHLLTDAELEEKKAGLLHAAELARYGEQRTGADQGVAGLRRQSASLKEYLESLERARVREVQAQFESQNRLRQMYRRKMGLVVTERGGQVYLRNPEMEQQLDAATKYWRLGGLSHQQIRRYLDAMGEGRFDDAANARDELIRAAERGADAWLRENSHILGPAPTLTGSRQDQVNRTAQFVAASSRIREGIVREISDFLGVDRPQDPLFGTFDKLSRAPIAGGLLKALQLGSGAVTVGVYDMLFGGLANATGQSWLDNRSDERREAFGNILDVVGGKEYQDLTWENITARLRAIAEQGSVGVTGDAITDFIIAGVTDPLIMSPADRLVRAGGLAIGEVGGLRAALRIGASGGSDLRALTSRTSRFFLPERFGGVARTEAVRIRTLQQLAREKGIPYTELQRLSPDDLYQLAKGAVDELTVDHLKARSEGLNRLLTSQNVNSQQLMSFVQDHLRDFFRASGRDYADALQLGKQIDEARKLHDAAMAATEALASADERLAARVASAAPLDKVRAERARLEGVAAPTRPGVAPLTGGAAQKMSRLERAYRQAVTEFQRVSQDTLTAAEHLASRDIVEFGRRRTLHAQLERGLSRLHELDLMPVREADGTTSRGIVGSRAKALAEYRSAHGTGAPSFPEVDVARIRSDHSYVTRKLTEARNRLAQATTETQRRYWRARLGRLEAARAGLSLELEYVSGPVRAAQKAARRQAPRVTGRFKRSQIAVWTPNARAVRTNLLREVSSRLFKREIADAPTFTPAARRMMGRVMQRAQARPLVLTGQLDQLVTEAGRPLTTLEAYVMTRDLMRSFAGGADWRDAFFAAKDQMLASAARHGITDIDIIDNWLDYGHYGRGAVLDGKFLTMRGFRDLDREIAAEIRRVTGVTRKGQTRAARQGSDTDSPFIMYDDRPDVIAAKMAVLEKHGLSLRAYDEMRSVLGDINQRYLSNLRLRRRAEILARETGRPAREIFEELREKAVLRSAEGDFAEFAARNENFGLSDDLLLRLWESDHAMQQMAPQVRKITQYQNDVLESVWETSTGGIKFGDEAARRRLLGGFDEVPDGARRAQPGEIPDGVDLAGTPLWIVPDNHPMMAGVRTRSGAVAYGGVHDRISLVVDNDGVWLIESALKAPPETLAELIQHELFHAWARYGDNYLKYQEMSRVADLLPDQMITWFFEEFFKYGRVDDFRLPNGQIDRPLLYGEWLADAFGTWKIRQPLTRTAAEIQASGKINGWSEIVELFSLRSPQAWVALKELESLFAKFEPADPTHFGFNNWHPPFGNRAAMRQWLVDNGFWSPKTAEEIQSGARVWTVDQEREFWQSNFGYMPPWTDEAVMRPLLDDPQALHAQLVKWGFFDDGFERLITGQNLTAREVQGAIAFGTDGLKRGRTLAELRDWVIQRYGSWVSEDGQTLTSMPELMSFEEYGNWLGKHVYSEAGLKLLGIEMPSGLARPGQMEALGDAIVNATKRHFERLTEQLHANVDVILPEESYLLALGIVDELLMTRSWQTFFQRGSLAQRLLRIAGLQRVLVTLTTAFPVMNIIETFGPKAVLTSLLRNRGRWIYFVDDEFKEWVPTLDSVAGDSPMTWGLSMAPAYQVIGDKRLALSTRALKAPAAVAELPLGLSQRFENMHRLAFAQNVAGHTARDLMEQGIAKDTAILLGRLEAHRQLSTFFSILEDASDFEKILNQIIPFFTYNYKNSLIGLRLIWEQPWVINFAQNLGELLEEHARNVWEEQFPGVPFPEDDEMARHFWFKVPWSDDIYHVDLAIFSDWTRQMVKLTEIDSAPEALRAFLRVPHPLQEGIWAALTGGTTPWGNPGGWRELSPWIDFALWLRGIDYDDPRKQRDLTQAVSQMLFFKAFGRIDPVKAKVQTFFAMMEVNENDAWDYYRDNPDLANFFASNGTRVRPGEYMKKMSWFKTASASEIAAYEAALGEYEVLRDSLDAKLDEFYLEPWSNDYRDWKKYRFGVIQQFLREHPILGDVWGFWMTQDEFATEFADFKTDMLVEEFFSIKAPNARDYASDLAYQEAVLAYIQRRKGFLAAHPDVAQRLYTGRTAVEKAWFDHELHWTEILENQAKLRIEIAEREAGLTGVYENDRAARDTISFLYELSDQNYKLLDAESFGQFYDLIDTDIRSQGPVYRVELANRVNRAMDRLKQIVVFPGRADYFYKNASPEERLEIVADEKYFKALGKFMDELRAKDDFSTFWTGLRERGLLDRYLRDNPGKRVDYEYSIGIAAVFAKGGPLKFWDNLMADPALLRQYLQRHPEKMATFERIVAGKKYFNGLQEVWAVIGDDFSRFYDELAKRPWLQAEYFRRHPEKKGNATGGSAYALAISAVFAKSKSAREFFQLLAQNPALQAEYFRRNPDKQAAYESGKQYFGYISGWVDALKRNDFVTANRLWEQMPQWVKERYFAKNPESAMRRRNPVQDSAYGAALAKWVDLLKAKEFVEADRYFDSLPDWIKERYFKRHPDQRAKHDLDSKMLAQSASYFLAAPGDKAKYLSPELAAWLREHGGDEAAMRGLIFAIYRAIPSSEPWLKRTFRQRFPELFGVEAQGERRINDVIETLAQNPDILPFYQRAFALQTRLYEEQLRLSKKPPKPLTMERKSRYKKRRKRRAARFHSRWSRFMQMR